VSIGLQSPSPDIQASHSGLTVILHYARAFAMQSGLTAILEADNRPAAEVIFDTVAAVPNIGNAYSYERWVVERDKFLALARDNGKLRVFWVTLDNIVPERVAFRNGDTAGWVYRSQFRVRGWVGLNDADATELDAHTLALALLDALDAETALHSGFRFYDASQAALTVFEPRTFYGILCHYVEVMLTVGEYDRYA
jgi:hypothetical protein